MNLAKSIRVSITVALVLAIGISGVANGAAPEINAGAAGKIEGSGATFPWNQYTDWFRSFTDENTESTAVTTGTSLGQFHSSKSADSLVLNYSGGGSSTGISNFFGSTRRTAAQMFSGTDAVLTDAQRSSIAGTDIGTDYSVIPAITGPLSIVYKLDGLKTTAGATATLRLNGSVVCDIYIGVIKKWNDDKIKKLNPSVRLPNTTISVVGRSDGSGTTFVFTSYLGKASTAAQKNCGMHSNFTSSTEANLNDAAGTFLPVQTAPGTYFSGIRTANGAGAIIGKPGNGGIAPYVQKTNGTISYVESSFALKYGLKEAALATKSKRGGAVVYLKPTASTVTSALKSAVTGEDPINPGTGFVQPVYTAGTNSYPIVGYSWLMIYHNYKTSDGVTLGQVQGMVAFMNWALTEGQGTTYLYKGYSKVPAVARAKAITELKKVTFDGTAVWP
jgi:phosphate ABC transporter phosphate-binding protein